MCGISAIVSPDPAVRARIGAMVLHQQHRGPDGAGQERHLSDLCSMGHNRLALQDLSAAAAQPMAAGRYTLVYNGEVYNHQELRQQHLPGVLLQSTGDTETLLRLIEKYGVERTLPLLNGMFAFAVWDSQERTLHMATDRFGVKPLYLYHSGTTLACASSSAALLELKEQWQLDAEGIAEFFELGGSARGVWLGIDRIGGGQLLTYQADSNTLTQRRWYTPTFNPNAARDLPDLVADAICISSWADVPVGLFYSGGVDTSVAAIHMRGAHAFHLDGLETSYAQLGARHFGLNLHLVAAEKFNPRTALRDIAEQSGEPSMSGHIPWLVSQYASKQVKACISGNGADELFFGYERTPRSADGASLRAQDAHLFRNPATYGGQLCTFPVPDLPAEFPADAWPRWKELHTYVQNDLNPTLDAASMCHGLELRVPYLDHRVVEAALSLDHNYHQVKVLLRQMLHAASLPGTCIDRPKLGFSMRQKDPGQAADWAWACRYLGMKPDGPLSDRDRIYLHNCARGFRAWYEVHEHRIAA